MTCSPLAILALATAGLLAMLPALVAGLALACNLTSGAFDHDH